MPSSDPAAACFRTTHNLLGRIFSRRARFALGLYVEKTPAAVGTSANRDTRFRGDFHIQPPQRPDGHARGSFAALRRSNSSTRSADLYERAHAEPAVVGVVYQRLRSQLTRQLRLPLALRTDAALAQAVRARLGLRGRRIFGCATIAPPRRAAPQKLAPAEALEHHSRLEELEEQFGLKRKKS